jgi:hypothetical protein
VKAKQPPQQENQAIVPMVRRDEAAPGGWSVADVETAIQLFACGMVMDGALVSRGSRDHMQAWGYVVRAGGFNALTGKGTLAFLLCGPIQDALAKLRAEAPGTEPLLGSPSDRRRGLRARLRNEVPAAGPLPGLGAPQR